MKKKVLFITQALWLGGIETALVNLLNHLDYDRFDVTCLITEDYQAMAGLITEKCRLLVADRGHTVSFSEPYRHARLYGLMEEPQNAGVLRRLIWRGLRLTCRGPEMGLYAAYIRQQLAGEHFDTCVIYSDRMAEIAVRAVNADRFLMFYHNADIGKAYHDTYGYRRSEKIIAVSQAQCEKLKQLRPAFANKMIAIPNYVDVASVLRRAQQPAQQPLTGQNRLFPLVEHGFRHQGGIRAAAIASLPGSSVHAAFPGTEFAVNITHKLHLLAPILPYPAPMGK